ncbi:MAG: hypothetical protein KatS3mg053_3665 [Candidatus Roseilinea sp.]|nr:MAG: hypothetical protein KatS3mg053_3665 [Candidatus Roseilinea sp.]
MNDSAPSNHIEHVMTLVKTYPSGADEWICPQCGRHFVMQWPPHYKRIILQAGDEHVYHSASKGGLLLGHPEIAPLDDVDGATQQDDDATNGALEVWSEWLDQLDFGDDSNDDSSDE